MSRLIVNTVRPVTLPFVDLMDLGQGQKWYDLTTQRVPGVNYTNDTGRPIMVNITETGNGANSLFYVNELVIAQNGGINSDSTMSVIVPAGAVYRYTGVSTYWVELR